MLIENARTGIRIMLSCMLSKGTFRQLIASYQLDHLSVCEQFCCVQNVMKIFEAPVINGSIFFTISLEGFQS